MGIPILLICFKRPGTFFEVLKSLRGIDHPVYVWVDGAKTDADSALANQCLDLIARELTLNVVKIKKNDLNFGNAKSIPTAIDWVFNFVDQVIIIEDDVILSQDFFPFAESVLNLHKHNSKVAGVSALNSVPKNFISEPDLPFRYSTYASVWGWAINKESWNELRGLLLSRIPVIKAFPPSARNFAAKLRWQGHLSRIEENLPVSWDYRLQLALFSLEKYFVVTNCNYSLNVGFGKGATNTRNRPQWVPSEYGKSIPFPINFKQRLRQDFKADNWVAKRMHHTKNTYWLKTRSRRFFHQIVKPN
jgi:hypothetical protein